MKSVRDIDVNGKTLFIRMNYNLPMNNQKSITDNNRIQATLELITYLIEKKAKLVIASHLGRPKGGRDEKFSLKPAATRLTELLNLPVAFADDCIGDAVKKQVQALGSGQILMLENLRFHDEEKKNDPEFAKALADLCDIYVNNAFAVSHRDQASVTGITKYTKSCAAGFLLEKEVRSYYDSVEHPKKPLVVVIGGAKVSSKLAALENMLKFVDCMIIGGAMANTFLAANGVDTKASMIEADLIKTASDIMAHAKEKGIDLLLPVDLVVAQRFDKNSESRTVFLDEIPDGWMALDIGPESANNFVNAIANAGTIVWNGPMGVFEMDRFAAGT